MLKQKTVYFREEDLPLWEAVGNKAEWLHNHLVGEPYGKSKTITEKPVIMPLSTKPWAMVGTKEDPDEEGDVLANWVWEERTHTLIDESTGEVLESDPDTIKELKKRGQVK